MGIVRDLYYARKMSAGLKLPAPTVALLIKRLRLAAAMGGGSIEKTVSGAMVHITDALAKAALSVLASIEPVQAGSGDPSPDNVRPITGRTGLSVYRHGKNLLNPATNITGKYIAANGSISNGDDAQYTDLIPVKAGETYVCSFVSGRNSGNNRWHGYNANGTWVKQIAYVSATGQQGARLVMTAKIDSGISYVRLSYGITDTEAMIYLADSGSQIGADGYYLGRQTSSTAIIVQNATIQSPYTTEFQWHGPAIVFSVLPGKIYAVKANAVTNYTSIIYSCYNNIEDIGDSSKAVSRGQGAAFAAPNGANYAVVLYVNSASGVTFTFDEPYATETGDYQPYVPLQTYSVDWTAQAGTVYGGTVDVVTGVLTVDTVHFSFDGTENWTKSGTYNGNFYLNTGIPMKWLSDKIICSHAKPCNTFPAAYQFGTLGLDGANKVNVNIWLMPSGSSKQDWLDYLAAQALAGTPVEMVCELATPLTYQLSAQEVQMLLGENFVWSSSGDTVSVTYYAEGNANTLQSLNILLGGRYSNPKTADDVSDREALKIILGGNI